MGAFIPQDASALETLSSHSLANPPASGLFGMQNIARLLTARVGSVLAPVWS